MNTPTLDLKQIKQINRLLLTVILIASFFGTVGLLAQLTSADIPYIKIFLPIAITIVNAIASILIYLKGPENFFHKYVACGYSVVFAFMLLMSETGTPFPYMIPIMIIIVLYLDLRVTRALGIVYIIFNVARVIKNITSNPVEDVLEISMVSMIISILTTVATILGSGLLSRFISENMESIQSAAAERARISENIINVTNRVTSDFSDLKKGLDEIKATSETVCSSIEQIGLGNNENLKAVELQTKKTEEIQNLVTETDNLSMEAVEVSGQMSDMLGKSLENMESLVTQAIETTNVGRQMMEAAERQQKSSEDAMNITDIIFSISGQTNLLALNASIEAARAGEAGKGFAVVATEISDLAAKTKQSTEQITRILQELTQNAGDVSDKAAKTVEMAGAQKELVEQVKSVMSDSRECSLKLGDKLHTASSDMGKIKRSNDEVVNSTTKLLSTSEQFTENTKESISTSRNNMSKIEDSVEIMARISSMLKELAQ
jgi:methyl-accepting chemotaxis protein